jgi:hypothetical protein
MLKLSDAMVCHCMHDTGDDRLGDGIHSEQKLFRTLWQVHNPMHSWIFVVILPTFNFKMVDKA